VIPPFERDTDVTEPVWFAALAYCGRRRAMLVVDAPSTWNKIDVGSRASTTSPGVHENAGIYFRRTRIADQLMRPPSTPPAALGAP
jgi:uncharacterized protein